MGGPGTSGQVEVDGRRLAIRNLDCVVFPRTGTTKADVHDYYVRVADVLLPTSATARHDGDLFGGVLTETQALGR